MYVMPTEIRSERAKAKRGARHKSREEIGADAIPAASSVRADDSGRGTDAREPLR